MAISKILSDSLDTSLDLSGKTITNFATTGIDDNASSTSLMIDSNGYITKPNIPCISLNGNVNNNSAVSAGQIEKNFSVDYANGITWNGTTGAITVPVAGKYLFFMQGYDNSGSTVGSIHLHINGVNILLAHSGYAETGTINLSMLLNLSANDYVDMRYGFAGTMYLGAVHMRIWGYLIG